ncbi:hypothetical protein [Enterobacter roggenkampii]|uniref:hypothetical protein n=1 Tax=Enterobacter cloacae complex TaxID=354276 RepID=UPI0005F08E13|nr:hypothetical protein [Enterobacter roggenkampii]EMC7877747.1 hypothetical protein [Enterobacter roggenkampii]KJP82011.1 hypothetical protein SR65_14105 [Enterobacter roggenkampii]
MAFVSQRNINGRQKSPSVRFRKTKSGAGGGSISKAVPLRGKRIDIQIDEGTRKVRLGIDQQGVSCNATGSFSCSLNIFRIVGDKKIDLTYGDDGWWYGDY